jgi:NADPH:quinone reductase-like Zn-dependent oxidoreductase
MAASNQAAWLDGKGEKLRVGEADLPKAESGDIVVKNFAVAVNPVDCKSPSISRGFFLREC